jgi:quercetin dioxygenase-like cupin family protein
MSETVEKITEVCGLYFRSVVLERAGDVATQHTHDHDHATYCGAGRFAYYANGAHQGEFVAGDAVPVRAGEKHYFVALDDGTRLTCVHDIASAQSIKERGL